MAADFVMTVHKQCNWMTSIPYKLCGVLSEVDLFV